jgi:hypothetical protein
MLVRHPLAGVVKLAALQGRQTACPTAIRQLQIPVNPPASS